MVLWAFVPTLIALQLFQPKVVDTEEEEALGAENVSVIHHPTPSRAPARVESSDGDRWT